MGDVPTSDDDYLAQQPMPIRPAKAPGEDNSSVGSPRLRAVVQVARAVGRGVGLAKLPGED